MNIEKMSDAEFKAAWNASNAEFYQTALKDIVGHRVEIYVDGELRLGTSTNLAVKDEAQLIQTLRDILEVLQAPKVPGVDLDDSEVLGRHSPIVGRGTSLCEEHGVLQGVCGCGGKP